MKPIELREADFRREINKFSYPETVKTEFFDYWSEPDRSPNPKMKWEKEKTWDLARRLARWVRTSKTTLPASIVHKDSNPPKKIVTEYDRLDHFMEQTKKPGSGIVFKDYGKWYDFMKAEKLLRPMTQKEIDALLSIYEGDKAKCRCAVVYETLKGYINHELRINDIIQARKKLVNG